MENQAILHTLFLIEQIYLVLAIILLWGAHLRKTRKDKHLEHEVEELERRVGHDEHKIERDEDRIKCLESERRFVASFKIYQLGGNTIMGNNVIGVAPGTTGKFTAVAVPTGSTVTGVPSWVSDNGLAVVTTDPSDSTGLSILVAVDASATGSFNLSIAATNPDGNIAVGKVNVPIKGTTSNPVQSFDINQTA